MNTLKVARLSRWSDAIEYALAAVSAGHRVPDDFYLSTLDRTLAHGGRVALVERSGEPIAVIGMRRDGPLRWKNATDWLMPGFVCAAADDDLLPAFARLRTEIALAWWRMPSPPVHPAIGELVETPVYRTAVADREAYWRTSSQWRAVMHARKRTAALDVTINDPGDAEWVIRSAARKWADPTTGPDPAVDDKVELAGLLESLGRHLTVVLRDGDRRLAGATGILDGDVYVASVLFRDSSVGNLPTGIRVIDETFSLCSQRGIAEFEIGGGYAYKARWAPEAGSRYELRMGPRARFRTRELITRSRQRLPCRLNKPG